MKIRGIVLRYFRSYGKYRVRRVDCFNTSYDRWDTNFSIQAKVFFFFWIDIKAGFNTCERAYNDVLCYRRIPKRTLKKHVMTKSDMILEMLRDE